MSEQVVVSLFTALLGAGALAPVVSLFRWLRRRAHARTPEGREEVHRAQERERQAEHWSTHDRSITALAKTRDELIEDITRIRADRDNQVEGRRQDAQQWAAERAQLLEEQRVERAACAAERAAWAAERAQFLAEVEHWERRFRELLEEFERWKRGNGYPVTPL